MPDSIFTALLIVHILCAIVGFGGTTLNFIYGAQAQRRGGAEAVAIMEANASATGVAEASILVVLVTGLFLAIGGRSGLAAFEHTWVWLSCALFVVGLILAYGVMKPGSKRLLAIVKASDVPDPERDAQARSIGARLVVVGPILDILWIVILILMVVKP